MVLPIKKQWFDLIAAETKKEEYREIKPYYTSRFQKVVAPHYLLPKARDAESYYALWLKECRNLVYADIPFEVIFRNGYSASSPSIKKLCTLTVGEGKPEWGAEPGRKYYILNIL